jgi:hypothetical protein
MNIIDLILCKVVTTEAFPERGWIGVVATAKKGTKHLVALHTRPELYRRVGMIIKNSGDEDGIRQLVHQFKVPPEYQLMFAPAKDAFDGNHARKLIESHLGG